MMILRLFRLSTVLTLLLSQIFSQVIITEVIYDLDGLDSPNEFVELYNTSSTNTVDLTNWTISDKYNTDDLTDAGERLTHISK